MPKVSRPGYTFDGWWTRAAGGERVTSTSKMPAADTTIYAHGSSINYTVTANANGGTISSTSGWTGTGSSATKTPITYGNDYGTLPTVSRTNYKLRGWHGRGFFDTETILMAIPGATKTDDNYYKFVPRVAYNFYGNATGVGELGFDTTKRYKITITGYTDSDNSELSIGFIRTNNTAGEHVHIWGSETTKTIISSVGVKGIYLSHLTKREGKKDYAYVKSIEVEEIGTPYEPYFITSSTKVYTEGNHTITAIWEGTPYKIRFNANGGTGTMDDQKFNYGTSQKLTTNAFKRAGYTFAGWATSANGSVVYTNEQSVGNLTTTEDQIINLYAKWTANIYQVTADANGGTIASTTGWTGSGGSATKNVTYGNTYGTLPTVTKAGYTLQSWNGKNLFNQSEILQRIDNITTTSNGYYKFKPSEADGISSVGSIEFEDNKQYTLSIKGYTDGGKLYIGFVYTDDTREGIYIMGSETTKTLTSNAQKTVASVMFAPATSSSSSGYAYVDKIQVEEGTEASDFENYYISSSEVVKTPRNHTIRPIWNNNTYKVQFYKNGGSGTMANQNFVYDWERELRANTFTREGYDFAGWTTQSNGTGTFYGDKQAVSNLTTTANGTVTLYAKWEPKAVFIAFDANGGSGGQTDGVMASYGKTMPTITSTPPTKAGYTFAGWYYYSDESSSGTKYYNANGTSARTWDLTGQRFYMLKAKWE